jgi:hypothetical protein
MTTQLKSHASLAACLLAASAMLFACSSGWADETSSTVPPQADKDGYYSLFDGKTLDGWKVGKNAESWSVADGSIVCHGPGPSHIFYVGRVHNHEFKNFHLKVDIMTFPHTNSGVYFDTKFQEEGWPDQGFEAQVNATHGDWKKTGSLYDVKDIRDPHHVDNKWFLYEIIVKDLNVILKVDGQTVCDWTQPPGFKPPGGHPGRFIHPGTFALQGHDPGSKTYFKNILVKPEDD